MKSCDLHRTIICLSVIFLLVAHCIFAQNTSRELLFNHLPVTLGLPTEEVQQIYQDRDGFMWFSTRNGLCRFDGYDIEIIKSNLYRPGALSSNDIQTVKEDHEHNLWIGTSYGLNVFNKKTGKIRKSFESLSNKRVQVILVTRQNDVWVGTSSGLYKYIKEEDDFKPYIASHSEVRTEVLDVKSMIEDVNGQIWIGTWSVGLYRYNPTYDSVVAYPAFNPNNSAHYIYQDSKRNIWVGTWEYGLYRLNNAYDLKNVTFENYRHRASDANSLSDDIVYAISEDLNTNTLWVGTRGGLSLFTGSTFINYAPNLSTHSLPHNEVNSILRDNSGTMWLGMLGGGVSTVNTKNWQFNLHRLEQIKNEISCNSVRSIFVDKEHIWLGIGSYGFVVNDRKSNSSTYYKKLPDFSTIKTDLTYFSFLIPFGKDELWMGSFGNGIYVYRPSLPQEKLKVINSQTSDWLKGDNIYSMFQDKEHNIYVGTVEGLSILSSEGKSYYYKNLSNKSAQYAHVIYSMAQDSLGNVWFGTDNSGLFRLDKKRQNKEHAFVEYSPDNGKINAEEIQCIHVDSRGKVWAGTDGGGLNLYDQQQDCFVSVHGKYTLPGDMICSILEDNNYNLWMGSNVGLIQLDLNDRKAENRYRLFTTTNGLQSNMFLRNAAFKTPEGELFFGGHKGFNSFYPDQLDEESAKPMVHITDIEILNRSIEVMDPENRQNITSFTPEYTDEMTLSYNQNNFGFKFTALNFSNPEKNEYAYKLEGFDKEWQYMGAGRHFASYNNLSSGTYIFLIKASIGNGQWSDVKQAVTVIIKPPLWDTWWAYICYFLVASLLILYSVKATRNKISLKNAVHIAEIERVKIEELNHAKLQFFTNITHELLTPLTILSASLDELKIVCPQMNDYYSIMNNNISRLKRLLQQILEFRKAETGNLKLSVSKGDLALFIRNNVNSFLPLIKRKKLQFSLTCDEEAMMGYFDPDKIDKILYNLLSNAFKYNKEGGLVGIHLAWNETKNGMQVTVSDNGEGISPEKMKTLFKRFYEGDYRRYNTIGTGIGLSLTKDLVMLHRGTIQADSHPNEGTAFKVCIPTHREAYSDDQIDDAVLLSASSILSYQEPTDPTEGDVNGGTAVVSDNGIKHTLLLVEDNEDLLDLMVKLLKREYKVRTATNGKEGIEILENEDVDLVVSDVMMPLLNGIELCRYLKKTVEVSHIPIILLTAKNSELDQLEGYEAGADGYITKPFNLSILHAKIKNLLKVKERTAHNFSKMLVFEMKELDYNHMDQDFMKQAVDCVHANLDKTSFDQAEFTQAMNTSKSTLYKKLKSLTGLSTTGFITNIRLKAACKIMSENSNVRVAELAYAVGYSDPKYFSACFRKEFGLLPTEYMNKLHEK